MCFKCVFKTERTTQKNDYSVVGKSVSRILFHTVAIGLSGTMGLRTGVLLVVCLAGVLTLSRSGHDAGGADEFSDDTHVVVVVANRSPKGLEPNFASTRKFGETIRNIRENAMWVFCYVAGTLWRWANTFRRYARDAQECATILSSILVGLCFWGF